MSADTILVAAVALAALALLGLAVAVWRGADVLARALDGLADVLEDARQDHQPRNPEPAHAAGPPTPPAPTARVAQRPRGGARR